jgi:hypothetical protein
MERITAAVLSDISFATGPKTRNHDHHSGAATTQLIPQILNREIKKYCAGAQLSFKKLGWRICTLMVK